MLTKYCKRLNPRDIFIINTLNARCLIRQHEEKPLFDGSFVAEHRRELEIIHRFKQSQRVCP